MPDPHEQAVEAEERRHQEAERMARGVEGFVGRSETGIRLTETAGSHLPHAVHGAAGGLTLLNGTLQFATGLNSAANGPPADNLTNTLRTVQGGATAVRGGAELMQAFSRGHIAHQLHGVGRQAGAIASGLDIAANVVDIHQHGVSEDNLNGLASAAVGTLGAAPSLVYAGSHAAGDLALRTADRAQQDEHLHPVQVAAGRGVNSGTRTAYETGTDDASHQGVRDRQSFLARHPVAARALGGALRPDIPIRRALGGQVGRNDEAETGATVVGAASTLYHAAANTTQGLGVAAINSAYGPRPAPGTTPWERALGVRSLTPYEISQLPSYDLDNPPPSSR